MVSRRDDLPELTGDLDGVGLTMRRHGPDIAGVVRSLENCVPAVLSRDVSGPIDIRVSENCILFCNLFEFVVRMKEIKAGTSWDGADGLEAVARERGGEAVWVDPVAHSDRVTRPTLDEASTKS